MADEDITRDDEIKFNLEVYQQPISECVNVTHLLMNLSTFSNPQRRELTQLAKTRPIDATRQAIGIILKDETPGIGTELIQSLQDDYPKVLKFLRGDSVKCDYNYRKIIELFSQEITNRIEPIEFLPGLIEHRVLVQTECEEICAEYETSGRSHAMWTTLLYVHRHQEEWFKYFLMSLIDIDQEDVALKLDPDLVEKIKIQRNEGNQVPGDPNNADQDEKRNQVASDSDNADEDDVVENVYEDYESGHYGVELNDPVPFQAITSLMVESFSVLGACTKNSDSCDELLIDPVNESYSKDLRKFIDEENHVTSLKQVVEEETLVTNLKQLVEDESHVTDLKQSTEKGHKPTDMIPEVNQIRAEDEGHETLMKHLSVNAERTDSSNIDLTNSDKEQSLGNFMNKPVVGIQQTVQEATNLNLLHHEERHTPILKLDDKHRLETNANKNNTKGSIKKHEKELNIPVGPPKKYIIPALRQEQTDNKADFYQRKSLQPDDVLSYKRDVTPVPDFQRDVTPVPPAYVPYSNTDTDKDTLENIPEHNISLYNYQRKWAERGADGTNFILIAPTNSGKTRVACKIIDTMFKRMKDSGKMGKAVFIVDRDELASQQGAVLAEQLPGYRTKIVTGPVQQNHNQFLKDYVHRRDILVVTAQVLLNCLKAKEISGLDVFDLLVFDECHHTDKKHPFMALMDIYFEMKMNSTGIPPQVIGLTATIGVAGSLDQISALAHMKSIAANLDATALVCPDDQDKTEIKSSIPKAEVCAVPWDKRRTFSDDIHRVILNMNEFISSNACIQQLNGRDKFMENVCKVPTNIGTSQFQNWLSAFREGIDVLESVGARHVLNPCCIYLEKYHVAMELFDDARTIDAKNVLQELNVERRRAVVNDAVDEFLWNECQKILDKSYEDEPENPKLLKLSEILTQSMTDNHEARCIVFVKTRILAQKLKDWMNETNELKMFNAREFLGRANDGMTIRLRKDTLKLFKEGIHKVIIATTVAEEGLDITACNLVIRYEHVTNENSRGQSRGRARADDSRYYVITNIGSWIVEKEEHNAKCEKLMLDLIPRLKACIENDRNKWEINVMTIQRQAKAQRDSDRLNQASNMIAGPVRIHCKNCAAYLCCTNDLRVVAGMHRVIIAPEIREKVVMDESFQVKHCSRQNGTSLGGNAYCRTDKCIFKHRIGGIMEFKKAHFPTLTLESISFRDNEDKPLFFKKKWGKIPIQIEPIEIEELYYLTQDNSFNNF